MKETIEQLIKEAVYAAHKAGVLGELETQTIALERPADKAHGDWSSAIALKSAKMERKSPRQIAERIVQYLPEHKAVESVEIAGPGFINFTLSRDSKNQIFAEVHKLGKNFGRTNEGHGKKVEIEYVSANPTGPLHIGHGRWAAIGDSLARIFDFSGYNVTREYYINDHGSQMDLLGASVAYRYGQLLSIMDSQSATFEQAVQVLRDDRSAYLDESGRHPYTDDFQVKLGENAYGGDYIIDLAASFVRQYGGSLLAKTKEEQREFFKEESYKAQLALIREVCKKAQVEFDVWKSEQDLYKAHGQGDSLINQIFSEFQEKELFYKTDDGAIWFKSTNFGDDKDRVVIKSNGEYTYFASDIAYTKDKFNRSDYVINILGADHHGYVPRIQAISEALGHKGKYEVLLGQFVNLLRGGQPLRMSKRRGDMITLEELLEEVGVDATRYTLISKSSNQMIDFDIEEVQREDTSNPVYYVQYAHARACSILKKANELGVQPSYNSESLALLTDSHEEEIATQLAIFSEFIAECARDRAPFRITHYLENLASSFHSFYKACQVLPSSNKVINETLSSARLSVVDSVRQVLEIALSLIGVQAPEKMDQHESERVHCITESL